MAFKRSGSTAVVPSYPVQLYRKLAETNDGPESLWFHQGTVLLDWHKNHQPHADVAIELPTGAGKTLVGGLIGDYRRRAFRERVAYLCPTRQLARQIADKLAEHGIPTVLLIGNVRTWNKADRARYTAANAIAVSVYSHVFNSNPAYEAALVVVGQLAGAVPSDGDGSNYSAPDAVWIFGSTIWVVLEAKSEAEPAGQLGADDVRQAGGHLRFTAIKRGEAAPGDSRALLVTPQERIHPSAHAVAERHVYVVRPAQVVDLFDRLVRAWRTARARNLEALSATDLAAIFQAEGALPTQWLPRLRTEPLQQDPDAE